MSLILWLIQPFTFNRYPTRLILGIGQVQQYTGLYFGLEPSVNSPADLLFVMASDWDKNTNEPIIAEIEGKQKEVKKADVTKLKAGDDIRKEVEKIVKVPEDANFGKNRKLTIRLQLQSYFIDKKVYKIIDWLPYIHK